MRKSFGWSVVVVLVIFVALLGLGLIVYSADTGTLIGFGDAMQHFIDGLSVSYIENGDKAFLLILLTAIAAYLIGEIASFSSGAEGSSRKVILFFWAVLLHGAGIFVLSGAPLDGSYPAAEMKIMMVRIFILPLILLVAFLWLYLLELVAEKIVALIVRFRDGPSLKKRWRVFWLEIQCRFYRFRYRSGRS